jgi:hypothetical protein
LGIKFPIPPAFKKPKSICSKPAKTTQAAKASKEPSVATELKTTAVKPAAGPLTLNGEPLKSVTTIPPIIPDNNPENKGALQARAMPMQRGRATKKTTMPALISGPIVFEFIKSG